jgi:hypothetical protein
MVGVLPALIVPGLPAMMADDEHLDALLPDGLDDGLQIIDQPDLFRDLNDYKDIETVPPSWAIWPSKAVVSSHSRPKSKSNFRYTVPEDSFGLDLRIVAILSLQMIFVID